MPRLPCARGGRKEASGLNSGGDLAAVLGLMDHKECLYARVYAHVCLSFCVDAALTIAGNLAGCLFGQGRHMEAEKMQREVLAALQRELGAEHAN